MEILVTLEIDIDIDWVISTSPILEHRQITTPISTLLSVLVSPISDI